jgi:hypothetical protein
LAFWLEHLLLLGLVGVFLWRGFVPAWKSLNTDFPDYYLAARLYRQGYSLEQIYDWTWIQRQKDHAGIQRPIVAFALLPPFSLLPVLPFSSLPPLSAKRCWLLVNLILLAVVGYLLHRMSQLGARRVAILMFLAVVPLRANFLYGQEHVLLLFLLTFAAWLYLRGQPTSCGGILAIAGALKIYPALFVLFFTRKRQWRAALGLCAGWVGLWLLSIGLFGFGTVRTYLVEVLPWPLRAEGQDPYNTAWNSFSALLHRLFVAEPELNPHPMIDFPTAYAYLQPLCQSLIFVPCLWFMSSSPSDSGREKLDWGVYVAMLLILSTNPASYDFNALILTAVFVFEYSIRAAQLREAATLVILYALVCLPIPINRWVPNSPTGWETFLAFPRLWAMSGLWIWLLTVLLRCRRQLPVSSLKWRGAVALSVIWLSLVASGVILNVRHQRREFKSHATRLVSTPGSLLASDPAVAGEKVLFTMMTSTGYDTEILDKGSLGRLAFGPDSFHPATAPGLSIAWVELASSRSRIVRFLFGVNQRATSSWVAEVEDGEKPAISPDGKWLAFVRESKGRGSLWIKGLHAKEPDGMTAQAEQRLSPPDLDVLDAAFSPTARIVLAARRSGGPPALFSTTPNPGRVVPEGPALPRRFPAASPDGRWLAFSQREGSNWQLWVRNLSTYEERRLTDSDCNSIAPAWYPDSENLVYATDCGHGYGLTALYEIRAVP